MFRFMRLLQLELVSVLLLVEHVFGYSECVGRPCDECHFYFKTGDKCSTRGSHPMLFCDPESGVIRQTANAFLECEESLLMLKECGYGTYYEDGRGCVDPTVEPFLQGLSVSGNVLLWRSLHMPQYIHHAGKLLLRKSVF
ncbi:hypothetical protein TELCIR_07560 [Teladorsagia circumcincta]|uniref:Chitin-binding type-2 domain-containing protein n=1 Tax=Teladorsagia circumcincta TaxID=45464 RepID=A0A2G9UM65_TELCI|nr:hypothetical protein TELCIR_07560 [Teladorsagia circumcincta]